ncbi:MAG: ATP-binding cassette domain-containing protein [Gammaproteobacteria bacterium]|nr:ATP-binding cassette domain-containing protein [Gammaproteobacteria bacterium]
MTPLLQVSGLHVALGRRTVLHDVALELSAGELAALIGPNGSGKSTLLAAIAGLKPVCGGDIVIDGHPVSSRTRQARERLGYMVAQDRLPGVLTPRQCLELFSQSRGFDAVPEATWHQADDFGLTPWMDEWLASCSLGTRQKVSVLLALLGSPPLILLDEPINGLDPVSALALKRWLRELAGQRGCTVLMATHDMAVVEALHDHVIVLLEGRILLDWDRARMARELAASDEGLEARVARVLGDSTAGGRAPHGRGRPRRR